MTDDRDFKNLVRARMERTGENYTEARAALEAQAPAAPAAPDAPASPDAPATPLAPDAPELGATGSSPGSSKRSAIDREELERMIDYAALGIRPEHIKAYRETDPGISVEHIGELWVLGVTPERFAGYSEHGLSFDMVLKAAAVGLNPDHIGEYAALLDEA